jgi:hypothetical protein
MASFKDKSITTPASMAGKKIGSWLGGNEPELFAALTKAGLDPTKENVIKQNFDMSGLLKGDLDVAQAMIYNEYAQVLEAKNPATGQLYKPEDLNVVDFNDSSVGTAMLQDQIFATDKWLKAGTNADTAVKFLKASFKGWIYCRDNAQKCVDIVLKNGSQLGASHQAWQMNEINALIWPSPNGHRPARQDAVRPDDPDRHDVQGAEGGARRRGHPDRPCAEGARRPRLVGRHQGRELPEGHGHAEGGRQLGRVRRSVVNRRPVREGRPPIPGSSLQPARVARPRSTSGTRCRESEVGSVHSMNRVQHGSRQRTRSPR